MPDPFKKSVSCSSSLRVYPRNCSPSQRSSKNCPINSCAQNKGVVVWGGLWLVTNSPGLSQTILMLALKVPHSGKLRWLVILTLGHRTCCTVTEQQHEGGPRKPPSPTSLLNRWQVIPPEWAMHRHRCRAKPRECFRWQVNPAILIIGLCTS